MEVGGAFDDHPDMVGEPRESSRSAIGGRLIRLRRAMGYDRPADFARHLGVSTALLANYETGARRPDIDQAFNICRRTHVTLDWLYFGNASGLPLHIAQMLEQVPSDASSG